jgi:hypothetical protein
VPSKARRVGVLSANPIAERAPTPALPRKRERGRTVPPMSSLRKPAFIGTTAE